MVVMKTEMSISYNNEMKVNEELMLVVLNCTVMISDMRGLISTYTTQTIAINE
jgi:hypothetical protein